MNQKNLLNLISSYSQKKLTDKEKWYSSVSQSYDRYRPRYPQILIEGIRDIVGLSSSSKILEIGCGPGIATVPFAELKCNIISLEPNVNFCELARKNCHKYSNVEIKNTSFEQWQETNKFDVVLAASSFHWVDQTIAYEKSSKILKDKGHLILLWNKELQPSFETYQALSEIYQIYAPFLNRYEDKATQEDIIDKLGAMVINSGRFNNLVSNYTECYINYTADDYLALLSTYSPYIELKSEIRENLFTALKHKIYQNWGGSLDLSYISAYHVAQKA